MAKLPPSALFPGITVTPAGINIPFSALPDLEKVDADPANGDATAIFYALLQTLTEQYYSLAPDARPAALAVQRSPIGASRGCLSRSWTISFQLKTPDVLRVLS